MARIRGGSEPSPSCSWLRPFPGSHSADSALRHVDLSTTCSRSSKFLHHSIYPLTRWLDLASILIPTTTAVYPTRFYPALSPWRLQHICGRPGTPSLHPG